MMNWSNIKKGNLKLLCSKCGKPAGLHGATDGQCPIDKDSKFKAYKDMRK